MRNLFEPFTGEICAQSQHKKNLFCTLRYMKELKHHKGLVQANVSETEFDEYGETYGMDSEYHYFDEPEHGWDMFPSLRFLFGLMFSAGGSDPLTGAILTDNYYNDVIFAFNGTTHMAENNIAYEVLNDIMMYSEVQRSLGIDYDSEYGEEMDEC